MCDRPTRETKTDITTQRHLHTWHPLHMQTNEFEICHTCKWDMSHMWMSLHTYDGIIETYQQVRSQIRTWYVAHQHTPWTHVAGAFNWINKEIRINKEKERHMHVRQDTYTVASWHIHACFLTHTHVRLDIHSPAPLHLMQALVPNFRTPSPLHSKHVALLFDATAHTPDHRVRGTQMIRVRDMSV